MPRAALVLDGQVELARRCPEADVDPVPKPARRPHPVFLGRDGSDRGRDRVVARRGRALVRLVGGDAGKRRNVIGRALEIERRGQVAADGTPPRRDVGFVHAKPPLEEADQRRVVERLRAPPSRLCSMARRRATAPGRRDRTVRRRRLSRRVSRPVPLNSSFSSEDGRLAGKPAHVRVGADDVVEEAVVLVKGDQ